MTEKTVALEDLAPEGAKVEQYKSMGMEASKRCDRCGAQAYLEVVKDGASFLMFCAHHAGEHMEKLLTMTGAVIHDHRPFLFKQEEEPVAL